jgi:hypothetical protein
VYRNLGRCFAGVIVLIASSLMSDTAEEYSRRRGGGVMLEAGEERDATEVANLATAKRIYVASDFIGLGGIALIGMGAGPYCIAFLSWLLIPDFLKSIVSALPEQHSSANTTEETPCDTAAHS